MRSILKDIREFRKFVKKHIHVLAVWPHLIVQHALNEPNNSLVRRYVKSGGQHGVPLVKWRNKPATNSGAIMTLKGDSLMTLVYRFCIRVWSSACAS